MADIDIAKPNPKKEKFAHISTSMAGSCASLLKIKLKSQPILGPPCPRPGF